MRKFIYLSTAAVSVFLISCGGKESADVNNETPQVEVLTEEQKEKVVELETLTEEVATDVKTIKEDAEEMESKVDELLKDI